MDLENLSREELIALVRRYQKESTQHTKNRITLPQPSDQLLRLAFETMSDGVVACDMDGAIQFVNPAMGMLTGRAAEKLVGRRIDQAWSERKLRDNGLHDSTTTVELEIIRPDGTTCLVHRKSFTLETQPPIQVGLYRDITHLKHIEQKLREEHDFLSGILQTGMTAIIALNEEGRIVYCNEATEKMLGVPMDRVLGRLCSDPAWDIRDLNNDPIPYAEMMFSRLKDHDEKISERIMQIRAADGESRILSVKAARLESGEEEFSGAVYSILNITEQYKSEKWLRLAERALESTFNGIVIKDARQPDVPTVYVNAAYERMTGYDASEIIGRNCRFLQGDDHDQEGVEAIRTAIREKCPARVRLRNYRKDGSMFWNELYVAPVCNEKKDVTHFVGVAHDVTEEQEALVALRESEEKYRNIIEQASDAIFVATQKGQLVDVNHVGTELIGYTKEELFSMSLIDLIDPDNLRATPLRIDDLRTDQSLMSERRLRRKDGSMIDIEINAKLLPGGLIQGIVRDLSKRREADALQRTLADLGQRLSGASSSREVAELVAQAADRLLGWDVCFVGFYQEKENRVIGLYAMDTGQDGVRFDCTPELEKPHTPSPIFLKTLREGAQIITPEARKKLKRLNRFGDQSHTSENILFVPLREKGGRNVGVLSVQSYTPNKYDKNALLTLQLLADSCAAAIANTRAEEALRRRVKMEEMIIDILRHFVEQPPELVDEGVNAALKLLGEFTNVDRSYFFSVDSEAKTITNTHEWCAPGIASEIENLQELPYDEVPYIMKNLELLDAFYIPSVADMSEEAARDRELLLAQSIQSLILIPVSSGNRLLAFIGFDSVREEKSWTEQDITGLSVVGEIIYSALQRKSTSMALAASEERLELALRGANLGLWDWNIPADRIVINDHWATMAGYDPLEVDLTFQGWKNLVHPDDLPEMIARLNAHLNGMIPFHEAEFRIRTKTGDWKWVQSRGKVVEKSEEGEPVRATGTQMDITERKQAELILRTIAEGVSGAVGDAFFRSVVQYLGLTLGADIVFVAKLLNLDPGEIRTLAMYADGEIVENIDYQLKGTPCRKVVEGQLNVVSRNAKKLYPDTVLAELDVEAYIGIPLRDSSGATNGLMSVMFRRPLESIAMAQSMIRIFAIRAEAELARMQAEQQRLELEAQVLHSQKLESLGILAGGIAHDFNNLLASVMGNAGLALMEMPEDSPARYSIEQIEVTTHRMSDLTRQMLAYSGRGKFNVRTVNLNDMVQEMAELLNVTISKKAQLKFDLSAQPVFIEVDTTQAQQILMNLITNASDALEEQSGIISISTSIVDAGPENFHSVPWRSELQVGEYVMLEVSDNGCGMDEATREKIFDPFFTTKFTGRGLGLAAVLGIVRSHRGAIQVESRIDDGTTFRVYFPRKSTKHGSESSVRSFKNDWKPQGTVLVVDDEESVRNVAARVLNRMGLEALVAQDGLEAIVMVSENRGELAAILLDLTMPHLSGEETFDEIRRIDEKVPVIMMSGYNEQEITERFKGKYLAGFLAKPFGPSELREKLMAILTNEHASQSSED